MKLKFINDIKHGHQNLHTGGAPFSFIDANGKGIFSIKSFSKHNFFLVVADFPSCPYY